MSGVEILVRFTVRLDEDWQTNHASPLVFSRWLPLGRENGLTFTHEGCSGLIWFDLRSSRFNRDEAEIARTVNVRVETLFVDIVTTIDGDLGGWMARRDFKVTPLSDEELLADRYLAHGKQVLAALSRGLNRFLSYVRIEKGQYWVGGIELDPDLLSSHAVGMRAQASVGDGGPWFVWHPTHTIHFKGAVYLRNDPRYLRPEDWGYIQTFLNGDRRPTLALELLAGAERLAKVGSDRAALTEAVSAVEVALGRFARGGRLDKLVPASIRERLAVSSLSSLTERAGLTQAVSLVLPFLFSESDLPAELLGACRDAIAQRNAVIHTGQRAIEPVTLAKHLDALRQLVELLLLHSSETE